MILPCEWEAYIAGQCNIMNNKILVTGSSGFIGRAIVDFLHDKGIPTVLFDIRENARHDICNFQVISRKISEVDGIIHTANVSRPKDVFAEPLKSVDINLKGTLNILEAAVRATKHPWVVFVSSREVFGDKPKHPVTEESIKVPKDLYVVFKIACEELLKVYSESKGVKARILRFSNVYTSRFDYHDRVIPRFIISASRNENIEIHGSGKELFDFVHIDDVSRAIWLCAKEIKRRKSKFEDFNIGSGENVTLPEAAKVIISKLNSLSRIKKAQSEAIMSDFSGDYSKAGRILRFKSLVGFSHGIDLAIKEFKDAKVI
jgi:nucleoside-diphosphate-sugar epimerase